MFYQFICLLSFQFSIYSKSSDPNINICKDLTLDLALHTDDDKSYVFKDQYFWPINNLDKEYGIIGPAKLITDKWPELTSKIKTAFVVFKSNTNDSALITVFSLNGTGWFGYQNEVQTELGLGRYFFDVQFYTSFTTSFTANYRSSKVFFLYKNKYQIYGLYNIWGNSIGAHMFDEGFTTIRMDDIVWLLEGNDTYDAKKEVQFEITNSIVYNDLLILISNDKFCKVDLTKGKYKKECKPESSSVSDLLKCPLDFRPRAQLISTENPEESSNNNMSNEMKIWILMTVVFSVSLLVILIITLIIVFVMKRRQRTSMSLREGYKDRKGILRLDSRASLESKNEH